MIPVGVTKALSVWLCFVDVVEDGERSNDGQHSGRSSEQPIKGTSMKWPSAYRSAVYIGIVHVPTSRDCPVYGAVGSIMVDGELVTVAKLDVVLAITVAGLPLLDLEVVALVVLPTTRYAEVSPFGPVV